MKLIITIILIIILGSCKISGQSKKIQPPEWSKYQGLTNWDEARIKCASIQMRLPTSKELMTAYKTNVTDAWKTDLEKFSFAHYWSSEEYSEVEAYYFSMHDDGIYVYYKEVNFHVRCIR